MPCFTFHRHSRPITDRQRQLRLEELESRSLLAGDIVLQWNDIALQAIRNTNANPLVASRALAIVQAAVYDAVNAIDRTHEVYAAHVLASPTTSREAAVAAAAHTALKALFPASQHAVLDAALTASLAAVPNGSAESLGVALGTNVAQQLLQLRAIDGANVVLPYTPGTDPGDWQPTPGAFLPALLPNWRNVTPFALESGDQFRPDGIPALDSAAYITAFNEVKAFGSATGSSRTQDQTDIALFWANGANTATPPGHLNILAQVVAEDQGNTLSENARLFAALNVALADAAIMAWDAKYVTNFWRPVTAIRAAGTDGNAATIADTNWTPLIVTPPFPTYVSGHSSFSGAAAAVLADFFGTDNIAFKLPSENPAVADRSFTSFSQAAQESAVSRLYGGIHYRFDNADGLTAGTRVGEFVAANFFEPADLGIDVGLVGTTLVVVGSEQRNDIIITRFRSQLIVSVGARPWTTFPLQGITAIAIDAHGGNDYVSLLGDIRIAATIYGGTGHDMLVGGQAADTIYGGDGNDWIVGAGGNDSLFGEDGHDYLFGQLGNDRLDGGDDDDWLFGGLGLDVLIGGAGNNRLFQ